MIWILSQNSILKSEQYSIDTIKNKAEFIKDIIGMANTNTPRPDSIVYSIKK